MLEWALAKNSLRRCRDALAGNVVNERQRTLDRRGRAVGCSAGGGLPRDRSGAEYLIFQQAWHDAGNAPSPALLGREFSLNTTLLDEPFYALHVWAWQHNPVGLFANWNPLATCEHGAAAGASAALHAAAAPGHVHRISSGK